MFFVCHVCVGVGVRAFLAALFGCVSAPDIGVKSKLEA